jgi:hypothetical protein
LLAGQALSYDEHVRLRLSCRCRAKWHREPQVAGVDAQGEEPAEIRKAAARPELPPFNVRMTLSIAGWLFHPVATLPSMCPFGGRQAVRGPGDR